MEKIEIRLAYDALEEVKVLFQEYTDFLQVDLTFQKYDEELDALAEKYAMPGGRLYLVYVDGKPAGCAAFHPLASVSGACELKRLYVRPAFRGRRLGRLLLEQALEDAVREGYAYAYLDTLSTLRSAVKLYTAMGFEETAPYYESPLKDELYYRRKL